MSTPTPKKPRKGGPGGRPVYTPETAQRRAQGRVNLALAPEDAATLRRLGAEHPGGMTALVTGWIRAEAKGS
jgi:hypothetical protein